MRIIIPDSLPPALFVWNDLFPELIQLPFFLNNAPLVTSHSRVFGIAVQELEEGLFRVHQRPN